MGKTRLAWLAIGAATVAWAGQAAALSLPLSSGSLGAGSATVMSCDSSGVDYRYALDGAGSVRWVTVANIDAACQGGTLRVTLTAAGADVGEGAVQLPTSGWTGTYAVSISPTPPSTAVTATYVAIEGP